MRMSSISRLLGAWQDVSSVDYIGISAEGLE